MMGDTVKSSVLLKNSKVRREERADGRPRSSSNQTPYAEQSIREKHELGD